MRDGIRWLLDLEHWMSSVVFARGISAQELAVRMGAIGTPRPSRSPTPKPGASVSGTDQARTVKVSYASESRRAGRSLWSTGTLPAGTVWRRSPKRASRLSTTCRCKSTRRPQFSMLVTAWKCVASGCARKYGAGAGSLTSCFPTSLAGTCCSPTGRRAAPRNRALHGCLPAHPRRHRAALRALALPGLPEGSPPAGVCSSRHTGHACLSDRNRRQLICSPANWAASSEAP